MRFVFSSSFVKVAALTGWLALLLSGWTFAGEGDHAAAFERLKELAGKWSGAKEGGGDVSLTYALVSDGTTLMETLEEGAHSMVTMYHMDGDRLMLTHYCAAGNQPRMVAMEVTGGSITFQLKDVTNLSSPGAGHMGQLVMKLPEGKDGLTAQWTWRQSGQEDHNMVFKAARSE